MATNPRGAQHRGVYAGDGLQKGTELLWQQNQ